MSPYSSPEMKQPLSGGARELCRPAGEEWSRAQAGLRLPTRRRQPRHAQEGEVLV